MTNLPAHHTPFNIQFPNGQRAQAVRINPDDEPRLALIRLGFHDYKPVIFITGGASNMSAADKRLVQIMMATVGQFAEEQGAVIVDGGTEAGVMDAIGEIRREKRFQFPLLGIAPLGRVKFPGYDNPDAEAELEDCHTHFILVEGNTWGDESRVILHTIETLCGDDKLPSVGVLINGGSISLQEVYLASTARHRLSIIVLEGSGRAADELSTAVRTGQTKKALVQAILAGGDIELVSTAEGPEMMRAKLIKKFSRQEGA